MITEIIRDFWSSSLHQLILSFTISVQVIEQKAAAAEGSGISAFASKESGSGCVGPTRCTLWPGKRQNWHWRRAHQTKRPGVRGRKLTSHKLCRFHMSNGNKQAFFCWPPSMHIWDHLRMCMQNIWCANKIWHIITRSLGIINILYIYIYITVS